jgi:nitric oxide reductase activation protein
MSASTAEPIYPGGAGPKDPHGSPAAATLTTWRHHREVRRQSDFKRIIDIAKESTVLLTQALESIGDTYGIYGFSGYGRDNVEFYVIKDLTERFGERTKRRIDKISPLHATRMGPAIRHATSKLEQQSASTKILLLLSDGRPQDRGYSRRGAEKIYAVQDTHMALLEAKRKNITPFCLTVDKAGHDYLQAMCGDMGYEVLDEIALLPARLPMLYRALTM